MFAALLKFCFLVIIRICTQALMSTNRLSLLVPDGLHTPSCGLSLWQHQDGEVPSAAAGPSEQQDKGKLYLAHLYNMFQQI